VPSPAILEIFFENPTPSALIVARYITRQETGLSKRKGIREPVVLAGFCGFMEKGLRIARIMETRLGLNPWFLALSFGPLSRLVFSLHWEQD
jgi:hypothetical protein